MIASKLRLLFKITLWSQLILYNLLDVIYAICEHLVKSISFYVNVFKASKYKLTGITCHGS
jgi:hypothetical protein